MSNLVELDTAIYFIQYVCLTIFRAKGRGKDRENMNKEGKGWKNTKRGGVWDEKTRMNTTNIKNPYFCKANAQ